MSESDFNISLSEAELISRLSNLEHLREQAREGNRSAMLANIEKLMEAELRSLKRLRHERAAQREKPEA